MEKYNKYDSFAYFYNRYWTEDVPELLVSVIVAMMGDRVPSMTSVLDICCGTGNVCNLLSRLGYRVSGLDGSMQMIEYAKGNAPDVELHISDVRDFELGKQYDIITCMFDSVNHIIDEQDLSQVFHQVNQHLKKGGYFIFDINSLKAAEDTAEFEFSISADDHAIITKASYDEDTTLTNYHVTTFFADGDTWQRVDVEVVEKYHDPKMIKKLLKDNGFKDIFIADGFEAFAIEQFEDRLFISAKKR